VKQLQQMTAKYLAQYPELADRWDEERSCWTVRELPGGLVVQVAPLLYTAAVLVSRVGAGTYEDRWCYHLVDEAWAAAVAWDGRWPDGEPAGWHRHPGTGRRRADGRADTEYVAP
jgi:hypothetical protein